MTSSENLPVIINRRKNDSLKSTYHVEAILFITTQLEVLTQT